jgi:hypothetical protein
MYYNLFNQVLLRDIKNVPKLGQYKRKRSTAFSKFFLHSFTAYVCTKAFISRGQNPYIPQK